MTGPFTVHEFYLRVCGVIQLHICRRFHYLVSFLLLHLKILSLFDILLALFCVIVSLPEPISISHYPPPLLPVISLFITQNPSLIFLYLSLSSLKNYKFYKILLFSSLKTLSLSFEIPFCFSPLLNLFSLLCSLSFLTYSPPFFTLYYFYLIIFYFKRCLSHSVTSPFLSFSLSLSPSAPFSFCPSPSLSQSVGAFFILSLSLSLSQSVGALLILSFSLSLYLSLSTSFSFCTSPFLSISLARFSFCPSPSPISVDAFLILSLSLSISISWRLFHCPSPSPSISVCRRLSLSVSVSWHLSHSDPLSLSLSQYVVFFILFISLFLSPSLSHTHTVRRRLSHSFFSLSLPQSIYVFLTLFISVCIYIIFHATIKVYSYLFKRVHICPPKSVH
ncbi:unnamed protein product [Acanthosepion pharaonis]|uniref:Uncharacterized protein n=1 Tax=Acanthosepion pharaonis TaxID=158019 RepID=A0A812DVG1_ACAPH|nr:unnamed protein product [Sepia pharaonis]